MGEGGLREDFFFFFCKMKDGLTTVREGRDWLEKSCGPFCANEGCFFFYWRLCILIMHFFFLIPGARPRSKCGR